MICPHCRTEHLEDGRFCTRCGAPLGDAVAVAPAASVTPPVPAATGPAPAATAGVAPAPSGKPGGTSTGATGVTYTSPVTTAVPHPSAPPGVPHRHFARTGMVLIIGVAAAALTIFLMIAVGTVWVLAHRNASAAGLRPPTTEPTGPGAPAQPGGSPTPPPLPAPPSPSGSGAPAPSVPTSGGGGVPVPLVPPPSGGSAPGPTVPPSTAGAPAPSTPPSAGGSAPAPTAPPSAGETPALPPSPGQPGQPGVAMQRYRAPSGQWGIDVPEGWQSSEEPNGTGVVFYADDPNEGTAFIVIPFQTVQAEMTARDILLRIVQSIQQRSPDLEVRINSVRDASQGAVSAQTLDADAVWTGGRGQAMRGHINLIAFSQRGSGSTTFIFLGGQSPAQAFDQVAPVFARMVQSFGKP
jgi:hypothetical protein